MDIERLLSRATDSLSVGRAFGPPIEHGGTVVIPVAWVAGGGGGGRGTAAPDGAAAEEMGSGGGFGGFTWPLGVYVLADGRVRWVPAVDATRLVLGALAVIRLVVKVGAARTSGHRPRRQGH